MPNGQSLRLRFLGGAGTVTGSKYLLNYNEQHILVDCGLFQGLKELRLKNWDRFPIEPSSIHAVVLTHAHIDHSGFIPRLVKEGFKGKVYCTAATLALSRILLPDTGYLQEEEAHYLQKKKSSKHNPPLPLFSKKDAEDSLQYFVPKDFDEEFEIMPGVTAKFLYAGHILGAAMVAIQAGTVKIGLSGDLGRPNDPVFFPPHKMPPVDYLVVESTYGNKLHIHSDPLADLEQIINKAAAEAGIILIPAFAVGRAQTLLYFLSLIQQAAHLPAMQIFLNSPMASAATDVFYQFRSLHKLSEADCRKMSKIAHTVESAEESQALNHRHGPMLIISASGMATGGRILHHLKAYASDPKNVILLSGYQAMGTRGQKIQAGAKEIKIHGALIPVNAKVFTLENLSAHADYTEILDWLKNSDITPKCIFVTHGEREASAALKGRIIEKLGWHCETPEQDQEFILN